MLLCALRRILSPSLAARHQTTSLRPQTLQPLINLPISMASTYSSPPVSSIDDDRQSDDIETLLAPLRKAVQEQGDVVRRLKSEDRPKLEVAEAVALLKERKKALEKREKELASKETQFDRAGVEGLAKRRFFYAPAFNIYGGVAGLYDFGPMGCAMKANLLSIWRSHFVLEENMLEVDCTMLTPDPVLRASGHVERFSDYMVKDLVTGECFRADHLLEDNLERLAADPKCSQDKIKEYKDVIAKVDNYSREELGELFVKYNVKAPLSGNDLSPPLDFNLMFGTSIGPSASIPGFLRPETAQGIFVNFKRLLDFNNGKLPFAAAQIGKAFRNEISPRAGLLRVREFEMAEIEHFVNPEKRQTFDKFEQVADLQISFYSACNQMEGKPPQLLRLGDAVKTGLVANETLGYYIGRIYLFLVRVGVSPRWLRFRQHMGNEMAHYAKDCWDAECKTSYGWVECVGCADRSCYDLSQHSAATKVDLSAKEELPEPITVDVVEVIPEKGVIGKKYRKEAKPLLEWIAALTKTEIEDLEKELTDNGNTEVSVGDNRYTIEPNMIKVKRYQKKEHVIDVVPSVIEPSFGIGRIIYAILEHNFRVREGDEQRVWLSLPPSIAPISCSILPLSGNEQFDPFVKRIATSLKDAGISHKVDDSGGSIGRRYARTDEIGIPYGITVDFDTTKTNTTTLRERNSTKQVRMEIEKLSETVGGLVSGHMTWEDVLDKYPLFTGQESTQ